MEQSEKMIVLELSTNTHKLEADSIVSEVIGAGILKLKIKGRGIVTHGEHNTIVTESENVLKYVQQELNPVTQQFQNAFD